MIGRLHVVTDFHFQQVYSHAELAILAARGGADVIQFRQKLGSDRHIYHAALATKQALDKLAASESIEIDFLIDDSVSLAVLLKTSGVHLGQDDVPVGATRSALPAGAIIGATATSVAQALRVQDEGATYIGYGPVYRTRSKSNPASVKGLDRLADVCSAVSIPVIAIGGVTAENTSAILAAGAYGVAVMTDVTIAPDPEAATRRIRSEIDNFIEGTGM